MYMSNCAYKSRYSGTAVSVLARMLRFLREAAPLVPVTEELIEQVDKDIVHLLHGSGPDGEADSRWDTFVGGGILWNAPPTSRTPVCGLPILRYLGLLQDAAFASGFCGGLRSDVALELCLAVQPEGNELLEYVMEPDGEYITATRTVLGRRYFNDISFRIKSCDDGWSEPSDCTNDFFRNALLWARKNELDPSVELKRQKLRKDARGKRSDKLKS